MRAPRTEVDVHLKTPLSRGVFSSGPRDAARANLPERLSSTQLAKEPGVPRVESGRKDGGAVASDGNNRMQTLSTEKLHGELRMRP